VAEPASGSETRVVGYVIADSDPHHGPPLAHVKDVAVDEEYRDQGIGSTLLRRALDVHSAAGATTAKLEVRESNDDAIRLYRRFGFEQRRRIRGYYGNGEDAIVMVGPLDDDE
jgi:ribosomal-protein-alanine N-acetyltransferase